MLEPPPLWQNRNEPLAVAVTTSLDGCFKLWVSVEKEVEGEEEKGDSQKMSWACRSVGYYHDHPCHGAAFSEDGSLLAINFSKVRNLSYYGD